MGIGSPFSSLSVVSTVEGVLCTSYPSCQPSWLSTGTPSEAIHTSNSTPYTPSWSALRSEAIEFCAEPSVCQKPRCATTRVLFFIGMPYFR